MKSGGCWVRMRGESAMIEERDLLICSVGNRWRGDDGAGPRALGEIQRLLRSSGFSLREVNEGVRDDPQLAVRRAGGAGLVFLVDCGENPEDILQRAPVNESGRPVDVAVIDAARAGLEPGRVAMAELPEPEAGGEWDIPWRSPLSTHRIPLDVVLRMFRTRCPGRTLVVGIQAESLTFGDRLSPGVEKGCTKVARAVVRALRDALGSGYYSSRKGCEAPREHPLPTFETHSGALVTADHAPSLEVCRRRRLYRKPPQEVGVPALCAEIPYTAASWTLLRKALGKCTSSPSLPA